MELAIAILAALALGAIGFAVGRSSGRAAGLTEAHTRGEERMRAIVGAIGRGRPPEGITPGTPEAELDAALRKGWAPREVEREAALREAIGRVSTFLDTRVRGPLAGYGAGSDADELRERIERALGALQDLDFFVSEMGEAREGANLASLAQGVSREFASDHQIGVRLLLESSTVRAVVNPQSLMDALYLVLHNAGRFGGGGTVDLTIGESDRRARIVVRDRGAGFSEETFRRAFDPFYSTSDEGLGLGLPHARKLVEAMGGRIDLRNVPDGGAEVELSFPVA